MAKEGSGHYRSGKSGTFDVIALGKDRFQLNYDETGAIVEAPENSPLPTYTPNTKAARACYMVYFSSWV
jgi:hypothetical protein